MIRNPCDCFTAEEDPLTLSLSPRGEGTLEWSSFLDERPQPAPSPLGERVGVRGSSTSSVSISYER